MPRILGVIPEHIRRKMRPEDRQPLGKAAMTMPEITAKAAVKLEKKLQEEIAGYLRMRGVTFGYSRMDKRTSYTVGWPDFTLVINGRACFLEVKRPGKKPTEEQEKIMDGLLAAGASVRVVHSLAEAIEAFKELSALWF
jgi:hypothetical protein